MLRYFLKRLLAAIPTIFAVVSVVFLLVHFVPGDPAALLLGDGADPRDVEDLRHHLGLDRSLLGQYGLFWRQLFDGSWGQSLTRSSAVLPLVLERFPATLGLALWSLAWSVCLGVPLGLITARKAGSPLDMVLSSAALAAGAVPIFVTAPLAVLFFAIAHPWLPVAGYGTPWHYVLPVLCLGTGLSGLILRTVRSSAIEALGEDYVRTARAKGLDETRILLRHVFRNSLLPLLTVLANALGALLAGAVLTETLFDWPGLGKLFNSAFRSRDYPLVQGIVLWTSVSYVAVHFLVDFIYTWADPKLRARACEE